MKVQEVILRALSGQLTWLQAADILGRSPRSIRRLRLSYERYGYDGLLDRRRQTPSRKRAPVAEVERMLHLYRTHYDGFNVRHFLRKARRDHGVPFCYRIKELKDGLALDRLSCSRFLGNQFRVLLTAPAYILMQALRLHATGTACATAQVRTLRERLLKVGVWVERSVRRIVLHFPTAFPWRPTWRRVVCAVGATP